MTEIKRRLETDGVFMNYKTDDLTFGIIYCLATYDTAAKEIYYTKENYVKEKKNIAQILNISTKTLNNRFKKLVEKNLIQDKQNRYIFPQNSSHYVLIDRDLLRYLIDTRNKNAIRIYIFLLSKYQWKQKTQDTYKFTNKEIIQALGYSENNTLINTTIKNILISLSNDNIIQYNEVYIVKNDTPIPYKELKFVSQHKPKYENLSVKCGGFVF